jgi:hypothetical protein
MMNPAYVCKCELQILFRRVFEIMLCTNVYSVCLSIYEFSDDSRQQLICLLWLFVNLYVCCVQTFLYYKIHK